LHIAPTGGKLWRLAYRFNGKQKTLSFGKYPAVSLQEARKRRMEATDGSFRKRQEAPTGVFTHGTDGSRSQGSRL
jgi:hypothetical protein